jgi:molecular chaperone GrpE (heat shock protein)
VHVVTPARPGQAAAPAASQPVPGGPSETPAHKPGQDIAAALQSLARQVSELQADNDRLREDYDQLSAEIARIRALMRRNGGAIAEQASQLLAGAGD